MSPRLRVTIPVVPAALMIDAPDSVLIDLRSPGEFAQDHVPGSENVPLFDDEERAMIGTLYARESASAAFAEGRERARAKIRGLVDRIGEISSAPGWPPRGVDLVACVEEFTDGGIGALEQRLELEALDDLPKKALVFSCWRGGLRSRSVVALVRELGLDHAVCLEGGYKAYRRDVIRRIADWPAPPIFVLRGLTGVGKTLVLRTIERLRPGWTLDLEELAGHRGSILGMVGLDPVPQRMFESRIAQRIRAMSNGAANAPCILEGESRKVGDVVVPETIWRALKHGTSIELVASKERRVDVLIDDYLARPGNREPLATQLAFLEARLGAKRWNGELVSMLDSGRERELVEILLDRYYDPLYRHSDGARACVSSIASDDAEACARSVVEQVESSLRRSTPVASRSLVR